MIAALREDVPFLGLVTAPPGIGALAEALEGEAHPLEQHAPGTELRRQCPPR